MDKIIRDDNYCFVCGKDNPLGLKLEIKVSEEGALVEDYVIKKEYEGYSGIVHGGILSSILDEIQVYAARGKGYKTVTAKLSVRFVKPVKIGVPIHVKGRVIVVKKGMWVETEGEIYQDGILKVKSQALLKVVS